MGWVAQTISHKRLLCNATNATWVGLGCNLHLARLFNPTQPNPTLTSLVQPICLTGSSPHLRCAQCRRVPLKHKYVRHTPSFHFASAAATSAGSHVVPRCCLRSSCKHARWKTHSGTCCQRCTGSKQCEYRGVRGRASKLRMQAKCLNEAALTSFTQTTHISLFRSEGRFAISHHAAGRSEENRYSNQQASNRHIFRSCHVLLFGQGQLGFCSKPTS